MKGSDDFPKTMQQSLRLSCVWMIVWPFIALWLSWSTHSWMMVITAPVSSGMIYWTLRTTFGTDFKKWWFLWRGPLIMMREDILINDAKIWLAECMPDRWNMMYPYVVKFKTKSDATAFKLVFG